MFLYHILTAELLYLMGFFSLGCLIFIHRRKISCAAFSAKSYITVKLSHTWKQSRETTQSSLTGEAESQTNTLYLHFVGRPQPQVILASPVSQPWREAHSFTSIGPAARWIAPSTGEERTGDSESLIHCSLTICRSVSSSANTFTGVKSQC